MVLWLARKPASCPRLDIFITWCVRHVGYRKYLLSAYLTGINTDLPDQIRL